VSHLVEKPQTRLSILRYDKAFANRFFLPDLRKADAALKRK
jgi:hypothetical protein